MSKKSKNKGGNYVIPKNYVISLDLIKKIVLLFSIPLLLNLFFGDKTFAAESDVGPIITSEAVILIEEGSGRVLYEQNSDLKMYPASLTKVATAIYAIEKGNLEDIVTVSENAREVDGTRVYLEVGEKVTLKKLIQGLLINSGNDAGVAIAEHLNGSEKEFAININAYLKEIGLRNTNFTNPHGLFDTNHTTTARDLALITQYAMKNNEFREIFGMKELKWDGEGWDTTLYNHHKLMRERPYEGVTGGKTGYVEESRHTLITTAKRGNMSVIAVVLKGQSQDAIYNNTVELLDYAFTNFNLVTIPKGKEYSINDKKFVTKEMYSFPISNNEEIVEEITNKGYLEIKNQFQEKIFSFPISELQKLEAKEEKQNTANDDGYFFTLNTFTLIAIAILGMYSFSKFRKNRFRLKRFW